MIKRMVLKWHIWWTRALFRRLEGPPGDREWLHYGAAPDGCAYVVRTDTWPGQDKVTYGPYPFAWQAIRRATWHVERYPRGMAQLGIRDLSTGVDRPALAADDLTYLTP
jgi:hypothetical protein